ncbi:hypothetical protein HPP92_001537 [Vanilla planifolia]|uniref:DAGKc domain-containing protein n=1 Tax=Vanilla planifolia TaxID=51239 RepID=A0A835S6T7_VANPL|nr:hypothetical protein HPP92_001537 [Vanilla planifolia]
MCECIIKSLCSLQNDVSIAINFIIVFVKCFCITMFYCIAFVRNFKNLFLKSPNSSVCFSCCSKCFVENWDKRVKVDNLRWRSLPSTEPSSSLLPLRQNKDYSMLIARSVLLTLRLHSFLGRGMGDSISNANEPLWEFYIPNYILVQGSEIERLPVSPNCPVIVFINSKSGGQLGGDLLLTYRALLNKNQVFDLGEHAPDKVLHTIFGNLERLKSTGDTYAAEIQNRLRLIVAGGDGTAGWLLGVVCDLKLAFPPPIATVPLGTGNNLPFSFGWGKKNPGTDHQSVKSFLGQVMKAKEMKIDSWHVVMRMPTSKSGSCDPVAPLDLPHSLHSFQRVATTDSLNMEGYQTYRGGFWNYFSMGKNFFVKIASICPPTWPYIHV